MCVIGIIELILRPRNMGYYQQSYCRRVCVCWKVEEEGAVVGRKSWKYLSVGKERLQIESQR
ncbi:hypothetical protein VULLAG_LOCUS4226 [Vulpes lagopus]